MAEARSAVDLFYVRGGYGLLGYHGDDDEEKGYYSVKLKLPTPTTVFKVTSLMLRRARYQLSARMWPASPMTALVVIGGVSATTVSAGSESWLRSGWLAELLWGADKVINAYNPLHRHFNVSTRVGYLAAVAAFAGMITIVTVERVLLKVFLSWQGWLYLGRTKKKPWSLILWAAGVKGLSGSKNLTYAFAMSLPSLPVPGLSDTCKRYLETVRPLLSDEEFKNAENTAKEFLKNEGPKLQRLLWLKKLWSVNYVTDWWEDLVYLRGRTPIMINSNYYVLDSITNINGQTDPLVRASNLAHHMLNFKDMIENETLEPMLINGMVPLCMEQYERMFGTCRVPGRESDKLKHNTSRYIVVMCRGHFYKLDVYHGARGTRLRVYSAQDILHQLRLIDQHSKKKIEQSQQQQQQHRRGSLKSLKRSNRIQSYEDLVVLGKMSKQRSDSTGDVASDTETTNPTPNLSTIQETDICTFTAGPRSRWADVREMYFGDGINRQSLLCVEKAAFVMSLEDDTPPTLNRIAKSLFHGSGSDRWFDKSINMVVYQNGCVGLNSEHSWADAPAIAHMWEYSLLKELQLQETQDKDPVLRAKSREPVKGLSAPKRLLWDIDEQLAAQINQSKEFAKELIEDVDLEIVPHLAYGKGFMKTSRIGPDAYIQMALQLAYYRDNGHFDLTYEASMTRLYRAGRTETVRSLSNESAAFVRAFEDVTKTHAEKRALLDAAAVRHQDYARGAMTGKGVDRHLFALYVVSKGLEIESPFLNEALGVPWRLSTSQQPQQQTNLRKEMSPEYSKRFMSPGGGFGPVADDGYGVSYMIVGEDRLYFHVSSKKSAPSTDSKRFGRVLTQALADMKVFLSAE